MPAYIPKTTPFQHQLDHFAEYGAARAWGLLWEQGTGKTKEAIDEACALWEQGLIDCVVIVAPAGVHRNWVSDELPKHLPDRLKDVVRAVYWQSVKSATKWHQKQMRELLEHDGFPWLFMNYDAVMTDAGRDMLWSMLSKRQAFYGLDEAHNIKTPGAKRTKRLVASGKYGAFRRIMTGTPVSTGPFDVYSQVRFLDPDFWQRHDPPLPNFAVFKRYYGVWLTAEEVKQNEGYDPGYDRLIEYRNLPQLEAALKTISSRVLKEDVLDLPPKLYTKRYFELTPLQERLLDELKRDLVAVLDNGKRIEAPLAITRLLRAQQITCGYAAVGAEEPVELLPGKNPRLALFDELQEALPQQGIVWARFRQDIDLIMDLLGKRAVRYDGQVSEDQCERNKLAFQAGDVQWFVATPSKASEGLTLTGAHSVIYYSNDYRLIKRLQSEDRPHRSGLDHSVTYYDLVTPRVDEHIVKALRSNFDIATQITGDRLREWI